MPRLLIGCTINFRTLFHQGEWRINSRWFSRIAFLLIILMTACRPEVSQGPLVLPTATATPRSTPLPPVPTVVPPGTDENPIQMMINPVEQVTDEEVASFEQSLRDQSGLVVEVVVVERYAEALAALCGSVPTGVSVAWLDGVTYQAAIAQNCGEPVIQVERDNSTGDAGQIVVRQGGGISSVQALRGRTFCRLGVEDYHSWLVPSLMMRASNLNPVTDLDSVLDFNSRNALIEALTEGDCHAAGISENGFDSLREVQQEALDVLETTPPLPHAVLMYPLSLPLGERIRLNDALLALAVSREGREAMHPLLGQDRLVRASEEDFSGLVDFLTATGLDFAQLGR